MGDCREDDFIHVEDVHGRLVVEGLPTCDYVKEDGFCKAYLWPEKKWLDKVCPLSPLASAHIIARSVKDEAKVNPIKMSKRGISQQ